PFFCPVFGFVIELFHIFEFFIRYKDPSSRSLRHGIVLPTPGQFIVCLRPSFANVKGFLDICGTNTNQVNIIVSEVPTGGGIDQFCYRRPCSSTICLTSETSADKFT